MDLPIYKLKIREDDQSKISVDYIALVDEPAIMVNWVAFKNKYRFQEVNKERRIIMGPAMVADMPIYRMDPKLGEYYVVFDKEEIFKIVQKFFRNGFTSNFNIMHDPNIKADGVYLMESFIVDSTRGVKAPEMFSDLPDGSWIISVKVDNDELYQNFIKTGQLKGFSIEGFFDYSYIGDEDARLLEEIINAIAA